MKNNDQRKAFIRTETNWKPIEVTQFTVTKLLQYKGQEWLKVSVLVEREKWWDREDLSRHMVKEMDDKGMYTVNADGDALCYTNETEMIDKMRELDKLYPDQAGKAALPKTVDVPRKGGPVW